MPWNCLYTLKNALNAGFEWPKFKAFSSSIRQTRVVSQMNKNAMILPHALKMKTDTWNYTNKIVTLKYCFFPLHSKKRLEIHMLRQLLK